MPEYTENERRRAALLCADTGEYDVARSLEELRLLCDTAEVDVIFDVVQRLSSPDTATYLGSGKLAEAAELAAANDVDLLIADTELSAVQLREIEQLCDTAVIDRTMLILDIFARSARTAEGKLQVELSALRYRLPRLVGAGKALSRLGGGIGTRGPGESKLESDRRHIRRRIQALEQKLDEVETRRERTRQNRKKSGVPLVALVGYTNVGKSTILNALTGAGVLAQDKLFATLDPTLRKLSVGSLQQVLMCDTVGFVSRLPHHLVDAFKSTLEEIKYADLIVKVLDASDPAWQNQLEVTEDIIASLGCGDIPSFAVFNKWDATIEGELPYLHLSAATGEGLDGLVKEISARLDERIVRLRLLVPFAQLGCLSELRTLGSVTREEYLPTGVLIEASAPKTLAARYSEFDAQNIDENPK